MPESHLLYLIVQDILATGEYNAEGIARYTDSHEDVIREVYGGRNLDPSARLFRKTIELHSVTRRDLYDRIIKKIAAEYLGKT
jgi:hypothetical protein